MVFNFKKTFTLGYSRGRKVAEDHSVVCLRYKSNPEFDVCYLISSNRSSLQDTTTVKSVQPYVATAHVISIDEAPSEIQAVIDFDVCPIPNTDKSNDDTCKIPVNTQRAKGILKSSPRDVRHPETSDNLKQEHKHEYETESQHLTKQRIKFDENTNIEYAPREDYARNSETETAPPKQQSMYSDAYSSHAASIFFTEEEPEPEERATKVRLHSDDDDSQTSA